MLAEYEVAIACSGDIDKVRQELLSEAKAKFDRQRETIEADYKHAQLLAWGLTQPKKSAGYGVARGFQNSFRQQHRKEYEEHLSYLKALKELTAEPKPRRKPKLKAADTDLDDTQLMQEPPTIDDL